MQTHPKDWTFSNISNMKDQLQNCLDLDWDHVSLQHVMKTITNINKNYLLIYTRQGLFIKKMPWLIGISRPDRFSK